MTSSRTDLACVLHRRAASVPDDLVLVDASGGLSAGALDRRVAAVAGGLRGAGAGPGRRVAAAVPAGRDAVVLWAAVNAVGAAYAPLPPGWGPRLLSRALARLAPDLVVAPDGLDVATSAPVLDGLPDGPAVEPLGLADDDDALLVLNSATPGADKAVRVPSRMLAAVSATAHGHFGDLRLLVQVPLHVLGGLSLVHGALLRGGSVVLAPGVGADGFWDVVGEYRVGGAALLDGGLAAVAGRAPGRAGALRRVLVGPPEASTADAARALGVQWWTGFNVTEVCGALLSGLGAAPVGTCGRPTHAFPSQLVSAGGSPVPDGEPGELVVRPRDPHTASPGYVGDEQRSAALWRGGALHTGHLFVRDARGDHRWLGAVSPAVVTPRGYLYAEDLESEVLAVPGVRAARARSVAGEVVLWVDSDVEPGSLRDALAGELPAHLVPRWLVRTPAVPGPDADPVAVPTGALDLGLL